MHQQQADKQCRWNEFLNVLPIKQPEESYDHRAFNHRGLSLDETLNCIEHMNGIYKLFIKHFDAFNQIK